MKKLLAVILAIVMMFSMTSVSFANEISTVKETNTIDNYVDYLEEKIEDTETNIFVKVLAKIVLVFIHFGFIKAEDFEDWFNNTAPENKEENTTDNTTNKPDTSDEWEDGTELKLYEGQTLPVSNKNGIIAINNISVTKEHFDESRNGILQKYKYIIKAEGHIDNYDDMLGYSFSIRYFSDYTNEFKGYTLRENNSLTSPINSTFIIDDNGDFVYYCEQYMLYNDYDYFFISEFEIM